MISFEKFKRKMELGGGSLRHENIANSINLLEETFVDDASIALGIYFWELGIDSYEDKEPLVVRIYKRSFSAANGVTMKFQTMLDSPVIVGDILYNSKSDEYFICTEVFNIDDIHWQGKLTLCNWILRWQNKNGDILEYPCHDMNTTQYNSGEQAGRQITIGSSQHMLTLPYDKNTVILKTPKRFFLDRDAVSPTAFEVTQNDTTSYKYGKKGLVKITVTECPRNDDVDRIDLGICDYIKKDDIAHSGNAQNNLSAVILYETKVIKSGGDMQVFSSKFFDENGVEDKAVGARWDVVCDFKDSLEIIDEGDIITIGINDDTYVDEEFKLILSDIGFKCSDDIIIEIRSLL